MAGILRNFFFFFGAFEQNILMECFFFFGSTCPDSFWLSVLLGKLEIGTANTLKTT